MTVLRPSFDALQRDPELGVLAILDTTLAVARFVLIATDQAVWLEPGGRASPGARDLRRLVDAIDMLTRRIERYAASAGSLNDDATLDRSRQT